MPSSLTGPCSMLSSLNGPEHPDKFDHDSQIAERTTSSASSSLSRSNKKPTVSSLREVAGTRTRHQAVGGCEQCWSCQRHLASSVTLDRGRFTSCSSVGKGCHVQCHFNLSQVSSPNTLR